MLATKNVDLVSKCLSFGKFLAYFGHFFEIWFKLWMSNRSIVGFIQWNARKIMLWIPTLCFSSPVFPRRLPKHHMARKSARNVSLFSWDVALSWWGCVFISLFGEKDAPMSEIHTRAIKWWQITMTYDRYSFVGSCRIFLKSFVGQSYPVTTDQFGRKSFYYL